MNNDTDSDELKDGDEVNTYGTDPLKYDTDEDGANDGWENISEYNPLVFDEYFSEIYNAHPEYEYRRTTVILECSSPYLN